MRRRRGGGGREGAVLGHHIPPHQETTSGRASYGSRVCAKGIRPRGGRRGGGGYSGRSRQFALRLRD